jgi:tetratricopeptide (TPR) repeat protein
LEKTRDQPTPTVSKKWLVEQIKICLRSSDHSRALELLRGAAAEFPNDDDAELSELEKLAHDGFKRHAEANRLITESQELFAQRKSAEAIQLLREAYKLDKNNSLARAILANALVEHAQSVVETDWLEAETLTNQALALNPAHPTAKTIHSQIVDRKTKSSVEDWVARASKLQSAGDLFAALAWVAEGLAVHPDDPKLVQIHDAIQRDQNARRRQARRGDLEDLQRLQREIDKATDVAAKQALAVRIQTVAAKHWTDGEILSIANALLLRLGLGSKEGSSASTPGKSSTVILHVPRPSAPEVPRDATRQIPQSQTAPSQVSADPVLANTISPNPIAARNVSSAVAASTVQVGKVTPSTVRARKILPSVVPPVKDSAPLPVAQPPVPQTATPPVAEPSDASPRIAPPSFQRKQTTRSNSTTLVLISAAAIVIVAVASTFFFTRKHYAPPVAQTQSAAPIASEPVV